MSAGVASVVTVESAPQRPAFKTAAAAVAVDVVVRDRRGDPVAGLVQADFELYEDGKKQSITAFDAVDLASPITTVRQPSSPDRARSVNELGADGRPSETRNVSAVAALAFEQLGPDARRLATTAATEFVTKLLGADAQAAVFLIGRSLDEVVGFTRDEGRLLAAIRRASLTPGRPMSQAGDVPGAEFGDSAPGQRDASTSHDSPYFRAHLTLSSLESVIASMSRFEGRKTLVVFSEGLAFGEDHEVGARDNWLEDSRREHFLKVLDQAHRQHVAFYTFDAAGLRAQSPSAAATFGSEPYVALKMLADETGGRYVESTNDLTIGMRRVAEDLRHYYLLGYTSTNSSRDGGVRQLRVKVLKKGLTVAHRRSYRAPSQDR
jgi:VWFA-related protein